MTKRLAFIFYCGLIWSATLCADTKIPSQLSFCLGAVSGSFAENPDSLKSTDGSVGTTSTPYAGTASSMTLEMNYETFSTLKRSYFIKGSGPIVGTTPDKYFSGDAGINFYFTQLGSQAKVSDFNFEMKLIPKMRYYAGPSLGVGYLVYNTKTATKSDVLFQIGGQGGMIYTINPKWGLKAELAAVRAVGVLVSSTVIKILIGTSYNLGL